MSVERSEFEFRVQTPLELAGAEEGACELEKALGKARALGRHSGRLERQLARVREGIRRFRRAHPGVGGPAEEREETEAREERNELRRAAEEPGAGEPEFRRRPAPRSQGATREREPAQSADSDVVADNGAATEAQTGALPEAVPASGRDAGTDEGQGANPPEAEGAGTPAAGLVEAGGDGESDAGSAPQIDEETMAGAAPATAAGEEPGTAVWEAIAQRQVEEMVQASLARLQTAQPQRQTRDEERMEAVEFSLRQLEERVRINRDGG